MASLRAFTLIELILVVSIITIVAASSSPLLIRFFNHSQFESASHQLISTINKAQEYALANKDNAVWGICLYNSQVRLFSASCESPGIKEDFSLPASVSVSGLTTTTFSPLRAEPSGQLTITLQGPTNSQNININALGAITIN